VATNFNARLALSFRASAVFKRASTSGMVQGSAHAGKHGNDKPPTVKECREPVTT
jgi:hypothetical protein